MILSEKHPGSSLRARVPLKARPLDLLYFWFFVIHLPTSLLVDAQHFYPAWIVPSFAKSLVQTYLMMSNDPLLGSASGYFGPIGDKMVWFNSFVTLELLFQVPVFILGARGLYKGSRAIYVLILVYGASTFTTLIPCLAVVLSAPSTSATTIANKIISLTFEQRLLLLSSYLPFAIIPLMMTVDMGFRILGLIKAGIDAESEGKRE
ncbi:hypothetical protein M378DRAFT_184524 [Amanita muscaria Koide BX008]|uniref:EXPERA domain-containing protein n=1 Tax=Amanita muscaria (strain Koide BX008) TaxID=946122 RepID=A0A0C2XIP8_AMAMK|nr:hypothetical protein M378DRAFT_184524 [Amanita muscaria Koide BX008]